MIQKGNVTLHRFLQDLTEVNVYMRRHQTRSFARTTLVTSFIANFQTVTFPIGSMVIKLNVMLELILQHEAGDHIHNGSGNGVPLD